MSPNTTARLAGSLYLASAIAAGVPLIYVPDGMAADQGRRIAAGTHLTR